MRVRRSPALIDWLRLPAAAGVLALVLLVAGCGGGDTATAPADSTTSADATPASSTGGNATSAASPTGSGERRTLGTTTGIAHTQKAPDFQAIPGATADFGTLGGSVYRIEMPDNWNGELVLFAHGVRLGTTEVNVSSPQMALREAWIADGYAWAASSYSENGYVPGIGADDTLALLDYFAEKYDTPERVYLYGESMGGHVTALLMEYFPDLFDGGLAVCGAMGGEEEIDYLIAWAMAAEYISGVPLPSGQGQVAMAAALQGPLRQALGTPEAPTSKGQQFISVVRQLSGGARPFFLEGLNEHYEFNFALLLIDPNRETLFASAATNDGIEYGIDDEFGITAAQLNAGIRRLPADPASRNAEAHPDAVPTSGRISAPLLTLHNTGDLFVPISNEQSFAKKVDAAGKSDLLVQRAIRAPGHCQFTDDELTTAWEDLRSWVEDGKRPAGEDLRGDLSDAGREFTSPLRPGDPGTK